VWEILLVLAIGLWRLLGTLRQWRPMPRWVRAALTVGAFVGVVEAGRERVGDAPLARHVGASPQRAQAQQGQAAAGAGKNEVRMVAAWPCFRSQGER
jgi:hypothetical protein